MSLSRTCFQELKLCWINSQFPQVIPLCFQFRIGFLCKRFRGSSQAVPAARPLGLRPGAGKGVHRRTPVAVLPDVAARILRTARRDENGCLISPLTPSQSRPSVRVGSAQVRAARIVMAAHIGRPIEAHRTCTTRSAGACAASSPPIWS